MTHRRRVRPLARARDGARRASVARDVVDNARRRLASPHRAPIAAVRPRARSRAMRCEDAQGLNRAVSAATDARALEDLVRENEGLMNAINCANVAGRAAKMCARARLGGRETTPPGARRAVLRRVADVAAASMRETPNEWWPRQCATVVWACGRAGARHEEVERAMEGMVEKRRARSSRRNCRTLLGPGQGEQRSDGIVRHLGRTHTRVVAGGHRNGPSDGLDAAG